MRSEAARRWWGLWHDGHWRSERSWFLYGDRVSGMEWGCKTIYGSLWLLCKHGRDERKENRGGQRSHDSETGGGVRISKAVMITDQSQPPEAGARQVVYTHTCARTHQHTHRADIVAGECALACNLQPGCETTKSPFTVLSARVMSLWLQVWENSSRLLH